MVAATLITALCAGGVAACGSDSGVTETDAEGMTKVVLGPARIESITNAAMVVGVNDKVFESCNLDASLKPSGGGGNQVQALQSGAIDVIFPSFSAVITAHLAGAELVVISGDSTGTNGMAWMTLPDSPLRSVTDLSGRNVSVSAIGSNTQTMLNRILKDQGMTPDSVNQVVIGDVGAGLAALASNAADAVWATEPSVTIFENSGRAKVLFRADDYVADNQLTVAAVRRDFAEQNPQVVRDVIQCLQKTRDIAKAETDRVAQDFATEAKLDPVVAQSVLKRSVQTGELSLDLTVPGMQAVLDSLIESGSVPAETTMADLEGLFAVPADAGVNVVGGTLP